MDSKAPGIFKGTQRVGEGKREKEIGRGKGELWDPENSYFFGSVFWGENGADLYILQNDRRGWGFSA